MSLTRTISGWQPWRRVATRINGEIAKGDGPFPNLYTPSNSFWMESLAFHCNTTWFLPIDPFSAFALSGGISGTLNGALGGLSVVNSLQGLPSSGVWGWELANPGPQTGYCVNSLFKQQAYLRFTIVNDAFDIIALSSYVELFQNYRSKNHVCGAWRYC